MYLVSHGDAARGLLDEQEKERRRERKATQADQDPLPAVDAQTHDLADAPVCRRHDHLAAEIDAQRRAADEAELQQREGNRNFLGRKHVRDERIGTRRMRRAACPQKHARGNELHEVLRETAQHGDAAGDGRADRQDVASRIEVNEARKRHADEHIEDDARRTAKEAQRFVAEAEVHLDALRQHAEHGCIEETQERGDDDDRQAIICCRARRPLMRACACVRCRRLPHRGCDCHEKTSSL